MIHERIELGTGAYVITYVHDEHTQEWQNVGEWAPKLRPSVLILPGGAFMYCSEREAEPTALPFLSAGYNVFCLFYRTDEDSVFPNPLEDVSKAIWKIRENSQNWKCDINKIAVCGFSAGGSLASMIATQWQNAVLADNWGIPMGGNKPNAAILCYAPVEGLRTRRSDVKLGRILCDSPPQLSTVDYVSQDTPPCFIWHTLEDEIVPVKNALDFAYKCMEHKVPFELHIYEHGRHGLSLNNDLTAYGRKHAVNVESWVVLCISWMNELFEF